MTGAVERWVRKTVKKAGSAYTASASTAASHGNAGVQGMGAGSGVGDLIELTDAFEIGDGEDSNGLDIGRGPSGSSSTHIGGDVMEGVRGRKLARDGAAGKSGKGD